MTFSRFDTIHEHDRQTNGHSTTVYATLMHIASHGKNTALSTTAKNVPNSFPQTHLLQYTQ